MSIVNYALDNELIGSKQLGTNFHRQLRLRLNRNLQNESADLKTTGKLLNSDYFTSKLPHILREKEFDLKNSNINKIFTSQWLDERKCILGTKCNKLVVLDTLTGKYSVQNPLKSHPNSRNIQNHCGIHSISINPSRTLLATGAENVNDLGIYSLPDLEPVMVGFNAHKYWIFDIVWLDDDHVVTGAGDNRLALWTVNNDKKSFLNNSKSNRINSISTSSTSPQQSPIDMSHKNKILNYLDVEGRVDRRYLKRPSPSSPPIGSRIPIRMNPFHQSPTSSTSSQFNSMFYLNRSVNMLPSPSSFFSSSFNRFGFYNIENYISTNRRLSMSSFLNPERSNLNDDNVINQNNNNDAEDENNNDEDDDDVLNNDNITEDEEEEEEEESNERIDFSSLLNEGNYGLNSFDFLDYNNEQDDLTEDDENELDDNDFNNFDDNSDDDSQEDPNILDNFNDNSEFFNVKKRRINYLAKLKNAEPKYKFKTPTKIIKCKQSKRIRALAFNPKRNEIAAISMNSAFHYFDINRFEQKYTKKLSPLKENVCLTINNDYSIYAIGSASHVQLLDANNARAITYPIFIKKDIGVRSLHFRNNVVSIGTGVGTVLFYDVRANKFLFKNEENGDMENHLTLQTNGGWILRNETYYENLSYSFGTDNSHAIYSHSYDPTGTKLLTVGGPLTINLYGHYAGIWQ